MKFQIVHETSARIRVQLSLPRMTVEQADLLETYLQMVQEIQRVAVHERTCCVIIHFAAGRAKILDALSRFSFSSPQVQKLTPAHTGRAVNRAYQEKLFRMLLGKGISTLFFPVPLRIAYTVIKAIPYLYRAVRCLLRGQLHVELLDGISIFVSLLRGDFGTAGSVLFLLGLGELLEEWTHKRSIENLASSMSLHIDRVWRKTAEHEECVPLSQIQPGDCVAVHMGSVIPLDGTVVEGEASVNQASLTGEPLPVMKRPGSTVYAGTVVEEGSCVLRAAEGCGKSRYDQIVAMIEQSEKLKSVVENRAASLADKLVPYTLAGSVLVYLCTRNAARALSVLMVDFSCALKLSIPLAVLAAMREAGLYHITVKGGKFLEAVAQADTVFFDKTGTLTHACPTVAQVIPFGGHEASEMLRLAACLEEHFPHSMANAVVQAARKQHLTHEEMHAKVEYIVAHGITSTVQGERVRIGSAHFIFEDEACRIPAGEAEKFDALSPVYSHLYLAIGDELAAVLCIHDPLRAEAAAVIRALHELGVQQTVMLTGDSAHTAAAIAAEVGVQAYHAEVLPEEKAHFVEQARAQGHTVLMLGDGVNDTPALSAADVGVAIRDGAPLTQEIADITIAADSLYELVILREIAEKLMLRIQRNYRFVIGFNGTLIVLGALGILPPAAASLLHNLSTLGASLHSMTNLLGRREAARWKEPSPQAGDPPLPAFGQGPCKKQPDV